jgi:hypothetical protein
MDGELRCLSPNYVFHCKGLGPCSASVRDCPAKCTGRHDPKDILESIADIEFSWNMMESYEISKYNEEEV